MTNLNTKQDEINEAIRNGGFYGNNGTWNSIIKFSGDNTLYRHRVETIVVKDNKSVFVKKKPDGTYYLPGGSTERDIPDIDQAVNECNEEAKINVRNIESTGISYKKKIDTPSWVKEENKIVWNGIFTDVYIAEYDSKYTGKIDRVDQDSFILSGQWYSIKDCFKFFQKEHREALLWYVKQHMVQDEPITESYISNYFKNKRFLKKVGDHPELERSAVDQIISLLKKRYSELLSTSKVKRLIKSDDVMYTFFPVTTLDFPDKSSITIALSFDDDFSPAGATHTEEYGDIVLIYPKYFKCNKETQIFTLLHEIGHIRLNHLKYSYLPIFNKDNEDHRQKSMSNGKSMYTEINADMYAVLNGASMYSILDIINKKDNDNEYDYRFTNAELADRYSHVFNRYSKYRPSVNESVTLYDLACQTLYEKIYFNEATEKFNISEKNKLFSIMYEFTINKYLKDSKPLVNAKNELNILINKYDTNQDTLNSEEKDNLQNKIDKCKDAVDEMKSKIFEDSFTMDLQKIDNAKDNNNKALQLASEKSFFEKCITDVANKFTSKYENTLFFEREGTVLEKYMYLIEALSTKERNKIPLEEFGIPEKRAYPLDTKKHVYSAIHLFGHCEPQYREELAHKIFKAMEKYNISMSVIGEKSKLRNYM